MKRRIRTEKEKTYGVWAVRSSASIFGHAEAWCKEDGRLMEFDSKEAAEAYAKEINSHTTANIHYYVRKKEPEPGAINKREAQLEKQKERKKQKKNRECR